MDALTGNQEEDAVEFRPEFAGSLRRSLKQVHSGEGLDPELFTNLWFHARLRALLEPSRKLSFEAENPKCLAAQEQRRILSEFMNNAGDVKTLREQIGYRLDVYGSGPGR